MKSIVMVPLDFSEKDGWGLAVAIAVARLGESDLHLVHAADLPSERFVPQARVRLAEIADRVAAAAHCAVTWAVLEESPVARALVRHIDECGAQVTVMATRAADTMQRALRGSVADQVLRESPRPVLLVPPQASYLAGNRVEFTRVLVPTDGSELADRALDLLLAFRRVQELEIYLLQVVPPGSSLDDAEARLEEAAARSVAAGARIAERAVIEGSDPARAIVDAIREALADLIVMSTRGQGGLRRLALGSVAEKVVRESEVPVLLLTPTCLERSEP